MALAIFLSFCETVWNDLFPGSPIVRCSGSGEMRPRGHGEQLPDA